MGTEVHAHAPAADPQPATAGRPTAGYATSLVLAILSVWFTVGLMVDAWAHNNVPELETFFTQWHAVFYSGFAATAGWVCGRAGPRSATGSARSTPCPSGTG